MISLVWPGMVPTSCMPWLDLVASAYRRPLSSLGSLVPGGFLLFPSQVVLDPIWHNFHVSGWWLACDPIVWVGTLASLLILDPILICFSLLQVAYALLTVWLFTPYLSSVSCTHTHKYRDCIPCDWFRYGGWHSCPLSALGSDTDLINVQVARLLRLYGIYFPYLSPVSCTHRPGHSPAGQTLTKYCLNILQKH